MFQKKNSQAISIRIRPASINPLLFSTLMLEGGDVTMFFMEDDIKSIAEDSHHHSKTYTLKSIIVYVKYAFWTKIQVVFQFKTVHKIIKNI